MTRFVLVLLSALVFAGSAHAATGHKPPGVTLPPATEEAKLARYLDVARSYWPDSACRGREDIRLRADEEIATMAASHGHKGYGDPNGCGVWVGADLDSIAFCLLLAHELGHTAGNAHSDDPSSIMWGPNLARVGPCMADAGRVELSEAWYRAIRSLPNGGREWRVVQRYAEPGVREYVATRRGNKRRAFTAHLPRGDGGAWVTRPRMDDALGW